ncbi:MAG TPA: 2-succinyl-5-enolpyruvyl-6-hydroxy-3-cyclohexene-1-carboxylic-acid synthase [Kofleriaceae bacterium]|nr:2-succinyl-5-enolpyruvyl-6-hydroxy-3-cyclohexene-1-carboxylic-acid synthase [Kofleriaceae bacterium]
MTAAVQTIWAELIAGTLADAGVTVCVISPGSRSTPLVAALAREPRLQLVTLVDERAAAFYALGAARATSAPAALVCTSGTAAAHYLPAIIEASLAGVPLLALTADRPPELHACGASQTIDQIGLYGGYVRAALDLGAPAPGELALRAVRRKLVQAVALARGPRPGPVHVEVPLRKPLEPAAPATDEERALARTAAELRGPALPAPPRLAADPDAVGRLAAAIAREPAGVIVAGALPASFAAAREAVFALAARTGYPIVAEAPSQLRLGPRPDGVVLVDHFDLIPAARLPEAALVLELGAEPVAAGWPAWIARARERWILAGHAWRDPDSAARAVLLGEPDEIVRRLVERLATPATTSDARRETWPERWRELERAAAAAAAAAIDAHPTSEVAVLAAAIDALPAGAALQLGNSLPIRTIDHVPAAARPALRVLAQRGAAGIDGLIASAAGATRAGAPVLLVLGDVSFAHDLGGLLAARAAAAPLAILVIDNGGGQIFAGLPVARAGLGAAFADHWLTAPGIDPAAVAAALGLPAVTAASPAAVAAAVAAALATPGATVIHAPVSPSGARDVRRAAIELCARGAL